MVFLVTRTIGFNWPNPDPPSLLSFLDGNLNGSRNRFSKDYDSSWHINNPIMQYFIQNMKKKKNNSMNKPHYNGAKTHVAWLALAGSWEPRIWPEKYWISATRGSITFHNESSRIMLMAAIIERDCSQITYKYRVALKSVSLPLPWLPGWRYLNI